MPPEGNGSEGSVDTSVEIAAKPGVDDDGPPELDNVQGGNDTTKNAREVADADADGQANQIKADAPASPSRRTLVHAGQIGLDPDVIAECETEAELQRAIKVAERYKPKDSGQSQQRQQQAEVKRVKASDIPNLDKEQYDEGLVKHWGAMKGLLQYQESVIEELRAHSGQFTQHFQQAEAAREHERFDAAVNALAKKDIFGEGVVSELEGLNKENRIRLWKARDDLRQSYIRRGEAVPTEKKLVDKAYRMEFGESIASDVRKDILKSGQKRAGMITSKPTNRKTANGQDPIAKAVSSVQALLDSKK